MSRGEELISIIEDKSESRDAPQELSVSLDDEATSDLKNKYLLAQVERLKEEVEGLKQDRLQRKIFGYIIFGFMCFYMLAVLILVYLQGMNVARLSDAVLITLLTTSLASVIGVFNFVAKYLFPNRK